MQRKRKKFYNFRIERKEHNIEVQKGQRGGK